MQQYSPNRRRTRSSDGGNPAAKDMQAAYRTEVERRLKELGWTQEDMDFPLWSSQKAEWTKLVEPLVPKEMNDETWDELKPKLISLLESYRDSRLKAERDRRETDRRNRLSRIFSRLKEETPPLVTFQIRHYEDPESSSTKTVSQELAFPEFVDALQWPLVKSLLEADTTADELEQTFNSRRAEIDGLITDWRNKLHKQMVDTIPKPDGEILRPLLTAGSNPYTNLSDETKLLLRADSLFLIRSASTSVLTYNDILQFTKTDANSLFSLGIVKSEKPLDIESIAGFPLANGMAQVLLKSMGCPDVSYLELEGVWVCGRCHDVGAKSWSKMVEHYIQEQLFYFAVCADLQRLNITYHELHAPELFTDRPMIKRLSDQVLEEELAMLRGQLRQCKVCAQNPIRRDVRGREPKVLKHLRDAHDITNPKFREHYRNPVEVAELNNPIGVNTRDMYDEDGELGEILGDGGEMFEYAAYGEYGMFDEDEEYDSDEAAAYGFGYNPDEWG